MTLDRWRVGAAAIRGTSHERTGEDCQDALAWRETPGGVLVAAVADGAGTARLGALGAALAASKADEVLAAGVGEGELPDDDAACREMLIDALGMARAQVEAGAADQGAEPRELASTLILLAAGSAAVACAQVGDGAAIAAAVDNGNALVGLTAPATGEYINETTFLISPGGVESAQVRLWRGQPAFVAMISDGLQNLALKMPGGEPHEPFFRPLLNFVRETEDAGCRRERLAALLSSPRVRSRADDDLTLLVAARL